MLFFHALVRHVEQLGLATGNGKFECCSNFAHGQLHATRNDLAEAKVNLALREKKIEELEADKKDATSSSSSTSNNEHGKSEYEHERSKERTSRQ